MNRPTLLSCSYPHTLVHKWHHHRSGFSPTCPADPEANRMGRKSFHFVFFLVGALIAKKGHVFKTGPKIDESVAYSAPVI